jgi:hypothetical protein
MTQATFSPASEKQLHYIIKLVDQKIISEAWRAAIKDQLAAGTIDKKDASTYLDMLFKATDLPIAGKVTEVGFYRDAQGTVWTVIKSKASGSLYAKQVTAHGFTYVSGAIKGLKADMKMTVDEIRAYGMETGICANCAAELSDPISIFIGLGTTCGPNLMGKDAYSAAKKAAKADPATAEAIAGKTALKTPVTALIEAVEAKKIPEHTGGTCNQCSRKTTTLVGIICPSCAQT